MDFETIQKVLSLGTEHKYLALAVFVVSWMTAMTSDWSKCPITVPDRAKPVVVLLLAQVYPLLNAAYLANQNGQPILPAVKSAAISGLLVAGGAFALFAVVVKAIYNGNPPAWLRWLAFAKKDDKGDDDAPKTPRVPRLPLLLLTGLLLFLAACAEAVKTTCGIIDIADQACTVLVVPGPDGGTMRVQVTRQELRRFAVETQMRHAAANADAGADAGDVQ